MKSWIQWEYPNSTHHLNQNAKYFPKAPVNTICSGSWFMVTPPPDRECNVQRFQQHFCYFNPIFIPPQLLKLSLPIPVCVSWENPGTQDCWGKRGAAETTMAAIPTPALPSPNKFIVHNPIFSRRIQFQRETSVIFWGSTQTKLCCCDIDHTINNQLLNVFKLLQSKD